MKTVMAPHYSRPRQGLIDRLRCWIRSRGALIPPLGMALVIAPEIRVCAFPERLTAPLAVLNALLLCLYATAFGYGIRAAQPRYVGYALWAMSAHVSCDVSAVNLGPYSEFFAARLAPHILATTVGLLVALSATAEYVAGWLCALITFESLSAILRFAFHSGIWYSHCVQRATGNFHTPRSLPMLIVVGLPFMMFHLKSSGNRRAKLVWLLAQAICLLAALLSFRRGALVACAAGATYALWRNRSQQGRRWSRMILVLCCSCALGSFIVRSADRPDRTVIDATYRIRECSEGFKAFIRRPIWGYGVNRADVAISDPTADVETIEHTSAPNNLIVAELLERGVAGLSLMVVAFAITWVIANRDRAPMGEAIRISLFSIFVAGLSDAPFNTGERYAETAAVFVVVGLALQRAPKPALDDGAGANDSLCASEARRRGRPRTRPFLS